jgi:hypothetical protein
MRFTPDRALTICEMKNGDLYAGGFKGLCRFRLDKTTGEIHFLPIEKMYYIIVKKAIYGVELVTGFLNWTQNRAKRTIGKKKMVCHRKLLYQF